MLAPLRHCSFKLRTRPCPTRTAPACRSAAADTPPHAPVHYEPSTCGHSQAQSACSKTGGSCGGGCSSSGNATLAAALGLGGNAQGLGSMNALMGQGIGIKRADIESAFRLSPSGVQAQGSSQGEKVLNIADILASCPDDLVFEDDGDVV